MDFICNHIDLMAETDVSSLFKLFLTPDTAARIVRSTENQHFYFFCLDLAFHFLKIYMEAAVIPCFQTVLYYVSIVGSQHVLEGMIHGLHDHHTVPFFCQSAHSRGDGTDNPGNAYHPFFFHIPSVAFQHPGVDGFKIIFMYTGVTKYAEFPRLCDHLADFPGGAEIHVSYPEGDHILRHMIFLFKCVFYGISPGPVNIFVKIVF